MVATAADKKDSTRNPTEVGEAVVYEVGYHLLPTISEAEVESVVSNFRECISKAGGDFIAEGAPQKMPLAYPMAVWSNGTWVKYQEAYFGWLKFEMEPARVTEIEQCFKEDKSVLRFLVVKTVREDTRANVRQFVLREVKRGDSIKSASRGTPATEKGAGEKVSEEKLDEVIDELTAD